MRVRRKPAMAVQAAGRSEGAKDWSGWLPPDADYRCEYLRDWVQVKRTYELAIDSRESIALDMQLASCARGETPKVPYEHHL